MKRILALGLLLAFILISSNIFSANPKKTNPTVVIISKEDMKLRVYDYNGDMLASYPMACGKGYGDKKKPGDMKTPEGIFKVSQIQDASHWTHDFKDGKGVIAGAYGPYFIRLATPGHKGIGIHGTHDPASMGTRASEGCIRLENKNVIDLLKHVKEGTVVIITPSKKDVLQN